MGLYVEVQYRGDWWGEDPLTETDFETTGDLFRALAGKDPARRWMSLGRCTGKVYVDGVEGEAIQVGWVFEARNPEPVNRGDSQPTGRREAWVTVYDAPPNVVTTEHPHRFGR